jgi:hypothetical protein
MTDAKLASGPAGSEQYAHPWLFQDYVPDVMVRPLSSMLQEKKAKNAGHEYRQF